ncbi:hypothetical protein [Candidatus Poriferisodalis sp.]|uniref:hypothetical protein n=1 Tax=Candidatus Poriferisodalis sp. TaxID=3101277 RepID=UPI003AF8F931
MVREGLGKLAKSVRNFLAALSHAKKHPAAPDPRKAAARRVRDAMHATRGNTGFSTSGANEKIYGKVLSDGHKQQR